MVLTTVLLMVTMDVSYLLEGLNDKQREALPPRTVYLATRGGVVKLGASASNCMADVCGKCFPIFNYSSDVHEQSSSSCHRINQLIGTSEGGVDREHSWLAHHYANIIWMPIYRRIFKFSIVMTNTVNSSLLKAMNLDEKQWPPRQGMAVSTVKKDEVCVLSTALKLTSNRSHMAKSIPSLPRGL